MTMLLVIRHAATAWNLDGRLQGRTDVPLSQAGLVEALRWRLPKGGRQAIWFTSPLMRARQTASQIGLSATPEPALLEMSWGRWEGKTLAELRASGELRPELEGLGLDLRPPGGESPRDVQDRLRPWLRQIAGAHAAVGAVTHKGVLRALHALATGWDMKAKPAEALKRDCAHCFTIRTGGVPVVAVLNIPL
ncbi:MAG: histidine phosphatase family protein [Azospirillum sp.]|nr:histidine phosphatase family protein [Azospirillum sp.]